MFFKLIFGTPVIYFFSFFSNYTEIEELRMDIKSYHGMKVKLKLFIHSEHYYLIDYDLYIVKLCSCSFFFPSSIIFSKVL